MMNDNPLVSIVVFTYNSAEFVVETLDSAKDQIYQHVELLISDDGSADDTLAIVQAWLADNGGRFVRTEILTVPKNTGISASFERGTLAAKGEWIKIIAGDDLLFPDCISRYVEYVSDSANSCFISRMKKLQDGVISDYDTDLDAVNHFFSLDIPGKLKYFAINSIFLNAPSLFIRRSVFDKYALIDTSFKLLEDQPLFFELLLHNEDIIYLDFFSVAYRRHSANITTVVNIPFRENLYKAFLKYRVQEFKKTASGRMYARLYAIHHKTIVAFGKKHAIWAFRILKPVSSLMNKIHKDLIKQTTEALRTS